MNDKVAYLRVYTWQGMSLGAQHWYADLDMRGASKVKVEAPLTQHHATLLNKEARRSGYRAVLYKRGEMYGGFLRRADAIRHGMKQWPEAFPGTTVLLQGRAVSGSPMPILSAPFDTTEANKIAKLFVDMGFYKGYYERGAEEHNAILDDADEVWHEILMEGTCEATE